MKVEIIPSMRFAAVVMFLMNLWIIQYTLQRLSISFHIAVIIDVVIILLQFVAIFAVWKKQRYSLYISLGVALVIMYFVGGTLYDILTIDFKYPPRKFSMARPYFIVFIAYVFVCVAAVRNFIQIKKKTT